MSITISKVTWLLMIVAVVAIAMFAVVSLVPQAQAAYSFSTNLKQGSTGNDVMELQKALNTNAATQVSTSGAGAPGQESTYFGAKTKAAVIKYQEMYASEILTPNGLTAGTGFVGASTRAKLNGMGGVSTGTLPAGCTSTAGFSPTTGQSCASGAGSTIPVAGGALSVSGASQPANALAVGAANRVPFTRVTLTAGSNDVTVNNITVERTGPAVDAVFTGVTVLDENGNQIGIAKTFNSNHQSIVGDPFTIRAGSTRTITIAGNMATAATLASYAGQVVGINVVAVNTNGTVSGSLPVSGAFHTVNASLTIGAATLALSSFDPNTALTKEIGTANYKFSGIRVTAGSAEQIRLKSVRFNQVGSAGSGDLANVKIYVDGTSYDTSVDTTGKYYTANFGSGIVVDKGLSKDVYIQGDIVGASSAGRNVQFDIYKNTDIYMTGETYGYGITATAGTTASAGTGSQFTTGTPFFDGSLVTVSAGSVTTVSKATSVAAQNIAVNVPNQVLGGFEIDLKGEPISVQSMIFTIASTTPSGVGTVASVLTNVSLYGPNGNVVAGPVDAVVTVSTDVGYGVSTQKVTFTDTVTFPIGKGVYTLKGKVPSSVGNGSTYIVSTVPFTQWSNITGQTTGNTISLSGLASSVSLNTMTVKAAALAISIGTTPVASNIVSGGTVTMANFQFDASQSGEDVRFSSIALTKSAFTGLSGCQLFDGTTLLNSTALNPAVTTAETITFDQQLTVTKGTVKTLTLKCNVSSAAAGPFTWTLTPSSTNPTVTGVTSGGSVTATGNAATSASLAIANGSLAVTTSPSSPSYALVAAGTTGNTVGVARFRATNEGVNLTRIGLKLNSTSTALTASSSPSDLVQVSIWDGATQVGTAVFTGGSFFGTSTLTSTVVLPKDADKDLTIKLDLASIDSATTGTGPGTQGALISVDVNSADTTGTQGSGANSGGTINATGGTAFTGMRMFKSYPTFAVDTTLSGNGVTDGKLMRFKVTANSKGGVGINQLKFTMSTTSVVVTAVNLFGFTDSTYASGISGFTSGQISASNVSPGTGGAITITPSAVINIPAGTTYYFELRGTVTGSGTAYSANTTLSGDSAYPSITPAWTLGGAGLMEASATLTGSHNLVWSPNATTTSAALHDDWTNGYGVPGLPSSGLSFNRAQ